MRDVTPTVVGAALQAAKALGIPYDVPTNPNTTLNDAVRRIPGYVRSKEPIHENGISHNDYDPIRDTPGMTMKYLAIGMGALTYKTGATRVSFLPVPHKTTDTGWYEAMPFALIRPGQADLSPAERMNYRLRRVINVNGEDCIAYYLRLLDIEDTKVTMESYIYENNEKSDPVAWVPSDADNRPIRPALPNNNVMPNNGQYFTAAAPITIKFSSVELKRIVDAVEILTGEPSDAIISEMGFVSASDIPVRDVASGGDPSGARFIDVVGAQVDTWYVCNKPVFGAVDLGMTIDVGRSEPLYGS